MQQIARAAAPDIIGAVVHPVAMVEAAETESGERLRRKTALLLQQRARAHWAARASASAAKLLETIRVNHSASKDAVYLHVWPKARLGRLPGRRRAMAWPLVRRHGGTGGRPSVCTWMGAATSLYERPEEHAEDPLSESSHRSPEETQSSERVTLWSTAAALGGDMAGGQG